MEKDAPTQVTQLLDRMRTGDPGGSAAAALLPLVYDELRQLAQARMTREPVGHTLQPTALVHEAYLRLVGDNTPAGVGSESSGWMNRAHFFAAAAEAMRRILVERARRRAAGKHGGNHQRVMLPDLPNEWTEPEPEQMLALDRAMERLAQSDRRLSDVVMLRFFAGLTVEQTALALDLAPATVKRDWAYARAWLFDQISHEPQT